jgi:hypothetical protein
MEEMKSNKSFEEILDERISGNLSRYESLAEELLANSSVIWEFNGTLAKIELAQGRVIGSIKPRTSMSYAGPLTSAPISVSGEEGKGDLMEMMAWLESEIVSKY